MIIEAKGLAKQEGSGHKILTPKQMLQRLEIDLAQINAGNNSESLLNEIKQIVYSLYQSEEIANYQMDHIQYLIYKIILSICLRNIVKVLIIHQSKYIYIKLKIELHLKLKMDIILNF